MLTAEGTRAQAEIGLQFALEFHKPFAHVVIADMFLAAQGDREASVRVKTAMNTANQRNPVGTFTLIGPSFVHFDGEIHLALHRLGELWWLKVESADEAPFQEAWERLGMTIKPPMPEA